MSESNNYLGLVLGLQARAEPKAAMQMKFNKCQSDQLAAYNRQCTRTCPFTLSRLQFQSMNKIFYRQYRQAMSPHLQWHRHSRTTLIKSQTFKVWIILTRLWIIHSQAHPMPMVPTIQPKLTSKRIISRNRANRNRKRISVWSDQLWRYKIARVWLTMTARWIKFCTITQHGTLGNYF